MLKHDEYPSWICPRVPEILKTLPKREPHVLYDEPDDVEQEIRRKLRTYNDRKRAEAKEARGSTEEVR